MSKLTEAQKILKELGLPNAQQNEISAYTLLALSGLKKSGSWADVCKQSYGVSKGLMAFIAENYKKHYAPNTRETFRRQVLHQFVQAGLAEYNPDIPDLPVNSPRAHYALSEIALQTIKTYKSKQWKNTVQQFKTQAGELKKRYEKERNIARIPIKLSNGKELQLSPGKHNKLQVAIIEEFASRFAQGAILLYLGDTENKGLYLEKKKLAELGIEITDHSKLPDMMIYDKDKKWLYLIEAVTSHGPMSPKRFIELEEFLDKSNVGKIYVSAFPDFSEFKRHMNNIAWDTEVWLAECPEHMIHFNGDRFMGPH